MTPRRWGTKIQYENPRDHRRRGRPADCGHRRHRLSRPFTHGEPRLVKDGRRASQRDAGLPEILLRRHHHHAGRIHPGVVVAAHRRRQLFQAEARRQPQRPGRRLDRLIRRREAGRMADETDYRHAALPSRGVPDRSLVRAGRRRLVHRHRQAHGNPQREQPAET